MGEPSTSAGANEHAKALHKLAVDRPFHYNWMEARATQECVIGDSVYPR